eukprot:2257070-Rhodomonas_salina.1
MRLYVLRVGNHMPREGDPSSMLPSSDNQGRIKLEKLPFGSFTTTVRPPQRGNDGDEDQASGSCDPLPPPSDPPTPVALCPC